MNEGEVHNAGQPIAALGSISELILSQRHIYVTKR